VTDEMRDRRTHERNVCIEHQAFVDFRSPPIIDCGYSEESEEEQAAEVEN
jgi:hypothetical protein